MRGSVNDLKQNKQSFGYVFNIILFLFFIFEISLFRAFLLIVQESLFRTRVQLSGQWGAGTRGTHQPGRWHWTAWGVSDASDTKIWNFSERRIWSLVKGRQATLGAVDWRSPRSTTILGASSPPRYETRLLFFNTCCCSGEHELNKVRQRPIIYVSSIPATFSNPVTQSQMLISNGGCFNYCNRLTANNNY